MAGGDGAAVGGLNTAEVYDPVAGVFTPVGNLATGRVGHSATLLPNGTVLIAGGEDQAHESAGSNFLGYVAFASAEVFDPATASFSPVSDMNEGRSWHTATLLHDGTVLLAGGIGNDTALATAEVYRP